MTRKQFVTILKSPVTITLLISLLLLLGNMLLTYRLRPFNSDDVFWQAILLQWHPFDGSTVTLGNSSIYVDKIPFFDFFNSILEPGRRSLLLQAAISSLLGFAGFYLASVYFLKKARAKLAYSTLIPFAWLASFGFTFAQLYLNTNWRGFQLGVSFAVFALAAAIWYGDIKVKTWWTKLALVIVSAYAGLQLYSDPYFLYFTVGPLAIFSILLIALRKINLRQFLTVSIPIVGSVIFAKLFSVFFTAAGVRTSIEYPMEFVHFENIGDGIAGSLHSILIIFSADFFGLALKSVEVIAPALNFILLTASLVAATAFVAAQRKAEWQKLSLANLWQLFFIGVALLVFATHSFSTLGQGTFTYRYFLLFALIIGLLFAFYLGLMKDGRKKNILAGLLAVAIVLNVGFTALSGQDAKRIDVLSNRANTLNFLLIDILKDRGYDKGYANYWDANISTYLSGGKVSFLPSVCNDHKALKWHWLINDNAFSKSSSKSFYYLNPDVPAACQYDDVIKQFGEPQEVMPIGNKTLFLYSHDITSQLGVAQDKEQ